ncbi:6-carboxytetrahydropterin synthase [bacterium]|nr:6-carboxytetrahydropterin synthase [bacterium]
MIITVCRKEQFNAAHRLFNPSWTEEQNKEFYGLCANPNYHGHNYTLIVKVTGEVDAETGYLIDLKVLKGIIKEEVIEPFDHRNLNLDVPEFKELIPSAEHIAFVIWNKIRMRLKPALALSVVLYETERNYVEYHGQ